MPLFRNSEIFSKLLYECMKKVPGRDLQMLISARDLTTSRYKSPPEDVTNYLGALDQVEKDLAAKLAPHWSEQLLDKILKIQTSDILGKNIVTYFIDSSNFEMPLCTS